MKNLITCLVVCVMSGATFATTWTVDDDGKADFDTVHEAMAAASSGDVILIAPGIYTEAIMHGSAARLGVSSVGLTLAALDPNDKPILDGLGSNFGLYCSTVLPGESMNLTNLVFRNCLGGNGATSGALSVSGDQFNYGTANVVGCEFENNHILDWNGSAIFCYRSDLNMQDCRFVENTGGRTVWIQNYGTLNATSCYFESNNGGAVYMSWGGPHIFDSCVFINNTIDTGGNGQAIRWTTSQVYLYNTQVCGSGALPVWTGDGGDSLHVDEYTNLDEFCSDCNNNGEVDLKEVMADSSLDCNSNFIIDECELDEVTDCNSNGNLDSCDLEDGLSQDVNGSGIPDECECLADIALDDGQVNVNDLLILIAVWDTTSPTGDINYDGIVDVEDLLILIAAWGACP